MKTLAHNNHDEIYKANKFWCGCKYGKQDAENQLKCGNFLYTELNDSPYVDPRCYPEYI